ncbi:nuclear transport factor 2 family protein (plasmid) [Rhodococcus opacus]|uniref:ester cyclase n=1 Tax=Rhodococcus opacus TaxID=37919 RepID=UPI0034D34D61
MRRNIEKDASVTSCTGLVLVLHDHTEEEAHPLSISVSTSTLEAYPERYLNAWNQRDIATALAVIHPKVHWEDPLLPVPLLDHDGAAGFFGGAWQGFPDLRFEAVGGPLVDAASGRVASAWRMTGTHTGEFPAGAPISGNAFAVSGTDVWEVDAEGRATSVHAYYDSLVLLRAIGLA